MKNDLLEILACPCCPDSSLNLRVFKQERDEIFSGELRCSACNEIYPIREGIPMMIPRLQKDPQGELNLKHCEVREANITYYDSVAEVYENEIEQAVHQSELNQRRMDQMVRGLAEKTQKELFLDLGCGTGNILKFGKKYFRRAVGIDISFNMLKQAKRNNLEVIQADTLFLPFKSSLFDVVSIFSVLHHIYDYNSVFNQIQRVLKKGGYLYSDWDPTKKPMVDDKKISWRIYQSVDILFSLLRPFKAKIKSIVKVENLQKAPIDFLKIRPDLKEINTKAEFHNMTKEKERGIDFDALEKSLIENDFINIQPTFHWSGKSIGQLSLPLRTRFFFLRFQDYPIERFMENIMIVTQKK
jgi:ubiquinone/menaquinone biosynthesis C-methylase UbiE/uncharacterized protein YbaR (Trm112 family)